MAAVAVVAVAAVAVVVVAVVAHTTPLHKYGTQHHVAVVIVVSQHR